jgi:hypothetical protein
LIFYRDTANESMRIDSAGRLMVGASSFAAGVGGSVMQIIQSPSSSTTAALLLSYNSSSPTAGQTLGRIEFSNNNHIGAASIASQRDTGTWTSGSSHPSRLTFSTTADGSGSATERMRIDSAGTIIIGGATSGAQGALTIIPNYSTGSGNFIAPTPLAYWNRALSSSVGTAALFQNNGGTVGSITYNSTATTYATSSDYRLKEDWQPMSGAITRLNQLKPVNFAWKADGSRVDGFLAHEAQEVVPEAVTGTKDAVDAEGKPEYQGIDQSKLVPLLTAALQEAVAKIAALESRLDAANL